MKRPFFIKNSPLLTLVLGLLAPVAALAGECPAYTDPQITIHKLWNAPTIDNSLDIQGITITSSHSQFKEAAHDEFPMGFTEAVQKLETSFQIKHTPLADGTVCSQISALDLSFGYPEITVFLAKELQPQSNEDETCSHREMKAHEMQHVAADKKLTETYATTFKPYIFDLSRQIGVMHISSSGEAEKQIHFAINRYMDRLNTNMATVHNNAQRKIDTKDEYNRLSNVCDGAMARMMGKR